MFVGEEEEDSCTAERSGKILYFSVFIFDFQASYDISSKLM